MYKRQGLGVPAWLDLGPAPSGGALVPFAPRRKKLLAGQAPRPWRAYPSRASSCAAFLPPSWRRAFLTAVSYTHLIVSTFDINSTNQAKIESLNSLAALLKPVCNSDGESTSGYLVSFEYDPVQNEITKIFLNGQVIE